MYPVLYCTDGWVVRQILAGTLPDIFYDWYPYDKAEATQASGETLIVEWTDPEAGTQQWMPDALLVAYRAQWDEAVSGRSGQTIH
jgi:hypothetical protein